MKAQKVSLFNPFTGKRRRFSDGYIPVNTLHDISLGVNNGGELLFTIFTDQLQGSWLPKVQDEYSITRLNTNLMMSYDLQR